MSEIPYEAMEKEIFSAMGVPYVIVGEGDEAQFYAIDTAQFSFERRARETSDKLFARAYDYDCPFSLLREFEKWWEWQKRTKVDGESTGDATIRLLGSDWRRSKEFKKEREMQFQATFRNGGSLLDRRSLLTSVTS